MRNEIPNNLNLPPPENMSKESWKLFLIIKFPNKKGENLGRNQKNIQAIETIETNSRSSQEFSSIWTKGDWAWNDLDDFSIMRYKFN